ncbi:50S ribosomal protein L25/general stress protein Ctc [Candidatus Endolissoclinum faulkneri]|nr:50S ribosomal protein L25/general stress protein Ctc [Candidatus Endolissoclinum faulkneri]
MSKVAILNASVRERLGKGSARAARRQGFVPAIIYGEKKTPIAVQVLRRELDKILNRPGFFSRLIFLKVGTENYRVLPRDLQRHPVSDLPWNIDFLRVSASAVLTVAVPIEFINKNISPGVKSGGVLNVMRHSIEVYCQVENIPDKLTIDLSDAKLGESIYVSSISLPNNVKHTINDRYFTIATIVPPILLTDINVEESQGESEKF